MNEKYVIVRTEKAGCFAGTLVERTGSEVVLRNARRLWYWTGAMCLSDLAVHGTNNPDQCKFPIAVPSILILGVIEVIDVTEAGRKSIEAVPEWKA